MNERIEKLLDSSARRKPFRVVFYSLLGFAGAVIITDPTQSLSRARTDIRWVWSAFIVVGAVLALYGVLRNKWQFECVGIIPLITAFLAYCVVLAFATNSGSIFIMLCFSAIVTVMISRFLDLYLVQNASLKMRRRMVAR